MCPADFDQLLDFLSDLFMAQNVSVGVRGIDLEVAKDALGRAEVGIVDVPVHDVGAIRLGVKTLRHLERAPAEFVQIAFPVNLHRVLDVDAFAC